MMDRRMLRFDIFLSLIFLSCVFIIGVIVHTPHQARNDR
jgi:hypothetical protein